jgi:hypothetical protein
MLQYSETSGFSTVFWRRGKLLAPPCNALGSFHLMAVLGSRARVFCAAVGTPASKNRTSGANGLKT